MARRKRPRPEPSSAVPAEGMMSPFPPIASYGFISDCHTGALIAPDGAVEWLCVPRFDAPSVFGALLDREAGIFRFAPFGVSVPASRHYDTGTNILITTWMTPSGWLVVRDALILGRDLPEDDVTPHTRPPQDVDGEHMLVRTAECMAGHVELELVCEPAPDYARDDADWELLDGSRHVADMTASGSPPIFRLRSDLSLGIEGDRIRGRHQLQHGEMAFCALSWRGDLSGPETSEEAAAKIATTAEIWRGWLRNLRIPDHPWHEHLSRSALTIKGLTYMPTGSLVAALTTSLPETPRGERNWDYRYTWMRDATFTLRALHQLGLDWEADDFMQFVADLERDEDGSLQIMYGIDGRRDLSEEVLANLTGYNGAHPVRIGNGAFDQRQNDVYGAVLDSLYTHSVHRARLPQRLWPIVESQVRACREIWQQPDQGIWEARGEPQHYVSSKLMCWVGMDRAAKLAEIRGVPDLAEEWRAVADEIHADVMAHGVRDGVLRQHYDTDALDASTLLAATFGFLPADDPVLYASVCAIADDLTEDGYVLRYRTGETDDGLSGKEGTFLICSFWLVSALAIVGELDEARDLMERLLAICSSLGLYAEEFEPSTHRHLGNVPQAFSHLALIDAAMRIIAAADGEHGPHAQ